MIDLTQGGDDILIGGDKGGSGIVTNTLVGDASETRSTTFGQSAQTQGGNDHLISGINVTDHKWGDWQTGDGAGGSDTFVFKGAFGSDFVYDFVHAQGDLIEFQVLFSKRRNCYASGRGLRAIRSSSLRRTETRCNRTALRTNWYGCLPVATCPVFDCTISATPMPRTC